MPIAQGPTPSPPVEPTSTSSNKRRFTGVHLAATGAASLLVGVLTTTLVFAIIGQNNDGDNKRTNSAPQVPGFPDSDREDPVADEDNSPITSTLDVGEGFTVTTWDGTEIEVYVHDFSVDQSCKYGQSDYEPEKAADARIVQLTVDVENVGGDSYYVDDLEALTSEGYSQPVEYAYEWCNVPDDGANDWGTSSEIRNGQKKLLYGAFEVRPDATQLVLASTDESKMVMDIPERGSSSESDTDSEDGSPDPTTNAG